MKEIVEGLERIYDEFETNKGESLIALYASDDDVLHCYTGGSIKSIAEMVQYVLNEGLKEDADETNNVMAHAIMVGVREFLSVPNAQTILFGKEMVRGILDAKKLMDGETHVCEKCPKRMTCKDEDAVKWREENMAYEEKGN